jgi:predicted acyl esterase
MGGVEFDRSKIFTRRFEGETGAGVSYHGRPPLPPLEHGETVEDGLRIIRNERVTLRDGTGIYIDIYLPQGAGDEPVLGAIVGWAAFGKHNTSDQLPPATRLPAGAISKHTGFEVPDPAYWCPAGYAIVYPDPRGSWHSEGDYYQGGVEIEDASHLCEWIAAQPWSNGKVAFTGVSYPATVAWQIGALNPPHLAAIMPWEGFTDMYREFAYHGGIRETGHTGMVERMMGWPGRVREHIGRNYDAHPFDDDYWAYKNAVLPDIQVPLYVCASWSDHGLHTRGTIEGWRKARSKNKWLQIHGRQKWAEYYKAENIARQRMFFDRFLLGKDSGIEGLPPVEIEVRERGFVGEIRAEREWPLARTVYKSLYLDAPSGSLSAEAPDEAAVSRYSPTEGGKAEFELLFDQDTELTGYMNLKLWVEADGADDMDLFVGIEKYDAAGARVGFPYSSLYVDGPVALGWLRVSHRELDPERSTLAQPFHSHKREQLLSPGEIVPVEVEIWPSSTLFRKGERLRLIVQGQDIHSHDDDHTYVCHKSLRNAGEHVIHSGGRYPSQLIIPVIPR